MCRLVIEFVRVCRNPLKSPFSATSRKCNTSSIPFSLDHDFPMVFKAFPTEKGAMRAENPLKNIAKSIKIVFFHNIDVFANT